MGHIVLLGDSTIDNAAYVNGGPDVAAQLRTELGEGWTVTRLAVDGDMAADIATQLQGMPVGATHVVVSVGGNDALDHAPLLEAPVGSVGEGLHRLAAVSRAFGERYRAMLGIVKELGLPTAGCTIYDANFPEPDGTAVATALNVFNDMITRALFREDIDLVDLRLICTEPADYANPIEPSELGGAKIAKVIARFALADPVAPSRSRVFCGMV